MKEAVQQLWEETGQTPTAEPVRTALAALGSYSMIEQEDGAVLIHRLVQEVTRARIPAERQRGWIELILRLVNGFAPFDADDVRTWPVCMGSPPAARGGGARSCGRCRSFRLY